MSGHEFEKQVRQKLNDLKIMPSADSWENIENKLRERKRRPVAFYWVPLLLIGLAAGGYLLLNNNQNTILSEKNSTQNTNVQPDKKAITTEEEVVSSSSTATVVPEETTLTVQENNKNRDVILNEKKNGPYITIEKKNLSRNAEVNRTDKLVSVPNNIVTPDNNITTIQENTTVPQKNIATQQQNKTAPQEKNIYGKNISLKTFSFPTGAIAQPTLKITESPKGAVPKINKTNRWSWGINAFAGISAVNEGHILNFNNAQVEDVVQVAGFAPRPIYTPSSISPGLSFSGGAFVKRELSDKFSLSLGLNYLQMNTLNKVGSEKNGSQVVNNGTRGYMFVYNYFTVEPDKQTDYRNKYHFIELPVELHTKVNKSRKTPITVNTGVSVSQLLKSNSLHFDGTTGVYYRNDKLLNQTQFAVKTGVSVGLLNKTTRPIVIGPSARYNVSKILQKDVSARKNFMSIGIDVKMFIR